MYGGSGISPASAMTACASRSKRTAAGAIGEPLADLDAVAAPKRDERAAASRREGRTEGLPP
jgi:hypothetical protein